MNSPCCGIITLFIAFQKSNKCNLIKHFCGQINHLFCAHITDLWTTHNQLSLICKDFGYVLVEMTFYHLSSFLSLPTAIYIF